MILIFLILIPLLGGLLAWLVGQRNAMAARVISLVSMIVVFILAALIWIESPSTIGLYRDGPWLEQFRAAWIPQLGIGIHLAIDGISLLLILLTAVLGAISILISWNEIQERVALFHFNLMWILAGVIGVFLSLDLFLFYFFWEMMLIPMYFLIGIWGHEKRVYAAIKFFIFTQASSLLMLLSIIGLYIFHHQAAGVYTFDYFDLLGMTLDISVARWLMLGFFVAFAVKIPAVPLHTWLADAHTEAPTAGSVILAGLLLKTGAYGIIRFVLPLFPDAAREAGGIFMLIGVIGIIYGAILSFAQNDLKRLVAYTSVSHLGFVLLGLFAGNEIAMQGAVLEMICHGFSTGALFIIVGIVQRHIHIRDMRRLGGLWENVPRLGAITMFFAMASLGLPGLGNFVAEILVLLGTFSVNVTLASLASLGLIAATVYSLWLIQKTFHGSKIEEWHFPDLSAAQLGILGVMMAILLWLGLYPRPVIETARPAIINVIHHQSDMENSEARMFELDPKMNDEIPPIEKTGDDR